MGDIARIRAVGLRDVVLDYDMEEPHESGSFEVIYKERGEDRKRIDVDVRVGNSIPARAVMAVAEELAIGDHADEIFSHVIVEEWHHIPHIKGFMGNDVGVQLTDNIRLLRED